MKEVPTRGFAKGGVRRKGLGAGSCYGFTVLATVIVGLLIFYYALFGALRSYRENNPDSASGECVGWGAQMGWRSGRGSGGRRASRAHVRARTW